MPWQMWVYLGIGVVVVFWFRARENHRPERYVRGRMLGALIYLLAVLWPVLLFAMFVNWLHRPKGTGGASK